MTYILLKFGHIIGAILLGGGLIGVWISDLRSRQVHDLKPFAEAIRNIAVFYDGVVIPGAFLLAISGSWLIVEFFGGWNFVRLPWLAGMVALFVFEFVEGNTITRLYFMKLGRLSRAALDRGSFTPELQQARAERLPTFTHFLDLPILFVIVGLGAMKPDTWTLCVTGTIVAVLLALVLTAIVPRLYPWYAESK